jgi:hypothetical protein
MYKVKVKVKVKVKGTSGSGRLCSSTHVNVLIRSHCWDFGSLYYTGTPHISGYSTVQGVVVEGLLMQCTTMHCGQDNGRFKVESNPMKP